MDRLYWLSGVPESSVSLTNTVYTPWAFKYYSSMKSNKKKKIGYDDIAVICSHNTKDHKK